MTIDGNKITSTSIKGPYGGQFYSCAIGTWAAGTHNYAIKTFDSRGDFSTFTGTFVTVEPAYLSSVDGGESATPTLSDALQTAKTGTTDADAAATQRAGLLTAVMHEMGSVLGNNDTSADDLVDAILPLGSRQVAANPV